MSLIYKIVSFVAVNATVAYLIYMGDVLVLQSVSAVGLLLANIMILNEFFNRQKIKKELKGNMKQEINVDNIDVPKADVPKTKIKKVQ